MIVGSPISKEKRNIQGAVEVAHFAFRSLTGLVKFQTVAIAFLPRYTLSTVNRMCGKNQQSGSRSLRENTQEIMISVTQSTMNFGSLGSAKLSGDASCRANFVSLEVQVPLVAVADFFLRSS